MPADHCDTAAIFVARSRRVSLLAMNDRPSKRPWRWIRCSVPITRAWSPRTPPRCGLRSRDFSVSSRIPPRTMQINLQRRWRGFDLCLGSKSVQHRRAIQETPPFLGTESTSPPPQDSTASHGDRRGNLKRHVCPTNSSQWRGAVG
jgi:hypothetical protein